MTTDGQQDVRDLALKQIRDRQPGYRTFADYYAARQPLTYATEKYRDTFARMVSHYTENMCATVVDALADRLTLTAFSVSGSTEHDDGGGARVWDIWARNHMDRRSGEVHQEAAKTGDAYVIVWPDTEGRVRIVPQHAAATTVHYDDETEQVTWAAKWWRRDDKRARLNIYWPDRIEKFVSLSEAHGMSARAAEFIPLAGEEVVTNPYGQIPVFHFANNAEMATFGESELRSVLPIQDALNKSVADLLVTMEYAAFPQRWATGLEERRDPVNGTALTPFTAGVERIWYGTTDVKFGDFAVADLTQFIAVHDMFLLSIARVTKTPTHYLLINPSNFPSGESLKTSESGFVSKVLDRQIAFGNVWEEVMTFAARVEGFAPTGHLAAIWQDPNPRSERDSVETAILKRQIGVSDSQLQREAGYSDTEIAAMQEENDARATLSLERQQQLINRGME